MAKHDKENKDDKKKDKKKNDDKKKKSKGENPFANALAKAKK